MHSSATTVLFLASASPETMSRGVEIAIIGMLMVFIALAGLSLFLALVPRVLNRLAAVWPETAERHAAPAAAEGLLDEEDEVLAAIGYVLHAEAREQP